MGELVTQSLGLNKLLLRNARKSPAEIEAITGIPAAEVAERLTELLSDRNWRDDLMEEKLLLAELGLLVDDVRDRMKSDFVEDEGWASMARVQLNTIKTMMDTLDKRRKAVDGQLSVVSKMQAQLMAAAISLAMDRAIFTLEKQFPMIDVTRVRSAFEEALPEAILELDKQAGD